MLTNPSTLLAYHLVSKLVMKNLSGQILLEDLFYEYIESMRIFNLITKLFSKKKIESKKLLPPCSGILEPFEFALSLRFFGPSVHLSHSLRSPSGLLGATPLKLPIESIPQNLFYVLNKAIYVWGLSPYS